MNQNNDSLEIIANLWYVMDEQGFIYSLRARLYVMAGSDDDKLDFLKTHSPLDFLIAQPFPLPKNLETTFVAVDSKSELKLPCIHIDMINSLGGPIVLFDEVFNILESQLPDQTQLTIPKEPLIVITPLAIDKNGNLSPSFKKSMRL